MATMLAKGLTLSKDLWVASLKMLSVRKQFGHCLSLYCKFSNYIPADGVIFSCLVNSALEQKDARATTHMLNRMSKEPEVHYHEHPCLFFRAYAMTENLTA